MEVSTVICVIEVSDDTSLEAFETNLLKLNQTLKNYSVKSVGIIFNKCVSG